MAVKWARFFPPDALRLLDRGIRLALDEDGPDLTSRGIFPPDAWLHARIRAKEKTIVAGLPIVGMTLRAIGAPFTWRALAEEGGTVGPMTEVAEITAPAEPLLKAERVILNHITHLSGIANLTASYVARIEGTGTRLLDTRKTLPGLRWLEKYAVQLGGGHNHRMGLADMLMLKDNHIDAAGSIAGAVALLREKQPGLRIEVECRTAGDVREALAAGADRIMLDNMEGERLGEALALIPTDVEAEASGGVTLDNIRSIAQASPRRPDFISVGRLTHSASAADFSMLIERRKV